MKFSRPRKYFWIVLGWGIVIFGVAGIVVAIYSSLTGYNWPAWTGWSDYSGPLTKDQHGKTLWDWMQLLVIPAVLAFGALWFNRAERTNERKIAEERNKNEQEIAADRMREAALQAYIDRMTELLLDKGLRKSKVGNDVRDVARTRTLTTLRMLDPARKGALIRFLQEAELITKDTPVINLRDADLNGAYLCMADLRGADLRMADLSDADLSGALLSNTNLSEADLWRAKLEGVDLEGAILNRANLCEAFLYGALLHNTNLREAFLREANLHWADLRGADLRGAKMEHAILDEAKLAGATMPDGTMHE